MDYDHYIAVDWSMRNMAIARMNRRSSDPIVIDVPSSVPELKLYLSQLEGTKVLAFEEMHTAQWLYAELKDHVEHVIICDPTRNRLLTEGAKTDKIDAIKLCRLLKSGLLKPVFHSGDDFMYMRKVVSGYDDLVKSGVRLKNQKSALFRSQGKTGHGEETLDRPTDQFVLDGVERAIESYQLEKKRYEKEFERLARQYPSIGLLTDLPGIGTIGATKLMAIVVDPRRFASKGHFLSYCGLVKLEKISGGRSYGRKNPRYNRSLKCIFKTAALSAIAPNAQCNLRDYYESLMNEKQYPDYQARHAVARRIAVLAYGVMKTKKTYIHQKGNTERPTRKR